MKYVVLLRGINVGKSVQVPMAALKELFAQNGIPGATTYLNTGNVLCESEIDQAALQKLVETELKKTYGQEIPTLVKTADQITAIADSIPAEWGSTEKEQTYVAYLFPQAARKELIDELPIRKQYMNIYYAHECIVWNIAREHYNRSHITKIVEHPAYAAMTTRNVNTARKLAELVRQGELR